MKIEKTEPIPAWIQVRYSLLWKKFKEKKINYQKIKNTLKEKDNRMVSVIISDLKKYGWIKVELDPHDSRKRIYQLISPIKAIEVMALKK